jgi:hypothetical protein
LIWLKPLLPFEVDEELDVEATKRKLLLEQRFETRE